MMKNLFLILAILPFFFSEVLFSQSGWIRINIPNTYSCRKIQFTSQTTGYIFENYTLHNWGYILKTTNTGDTWSLNFANTENVTLTDICFINNLTGFVCGLNAGYQAIILKTTNGGTNWFNVHQHNYSTSNFTRLIFAGDSTGYAFGYGFTSESFLIQYKTSNMGTTWDSVSYLYPPIADIKFINNQTGFITSNASTIFKTTNAGINWIIKSSGMVNTLTEIFFINNVGFICGNDNSLVKSTDTGESWSLLQFNVNAFPIKSIYFTNVNTGYYLYGDSFGSTSINKTTNSGYNWSVQPLQQQYILNKISFINNDTGFAVGENGTLLRTFSGGNPIGIHPISSEIPKSFSLSQNYPNPFNPTTKIKFDIQNSSFASLKIYDVTGKEIAALVNEQLKPGSYVVNFDGTNYPSGVYFYKLTTEKFTKKMVMSK